MPLTRGVVADLPTLRLRAASVGEDHPKPTPWRWFLVRQLGGTAGHPTRNSVHSRFTALSTSDYDGLGQTDLELEPSVMRDSSPAFGDTAGGAPEVS